MPEEASEGSPNGALRDYLQRWYRIGLTLSVLGPIWLLLFGIYYGFRNLCLESCEQPAIQPDDRWAAWLGTAVCVVVVWAATLLIAECRRRFRERLLSSREIWSTRAVPWMIGLAVLGAAYAVAAQSSFEGGPGDWQYTGGSVWLWLLPVLGGIGLGFLAVRRLSAAMLRTIATVLLAAAVVGSGYVVVDSPSGSAASQVASPLAGPRAFSISQPEEVVAACAEPSDFAPACGDAGSPAVVANPRTGEFAALYTIFGSTMALVGRSLAPGDDGHTPVVLRSALADQQRQSIGFGGTFDALPAPGGGFVLASDEFGLQEQGVVTTTASAGPLTLQALDAQLNPGGKAFSVPSRFTEAQQAPSVALDPERDRVLVAESSVQGQPMEVQLLDLSGHLIGEAMIPAASAYGGDTGYRTAAVYDESAKSFLVAWQNGMEGILVQVLDDRGRPAGQPILAAGPEALPATDIELSYNPQASATLLAWETTNPSVAGSEGSVTARLVSAQKHELGPTAVLGRSTGFGGGVQVGPSGKDFLVSWSSSHQVPDAAFPDGVWAATFDSESSRPTVARLVWERRNEAGEIAWDLDPATATGLISWVYDDREIRGEFVSLSR